MTATPTPRTDDEAFPLEHANLDVEQVVNADFARTLERELADTDALMKAEAEAHLETQRRLSKGQSLELAARTTETLDAERYRFLRDQAMKMDDVPSIVAGASGEFDFLEGARADEHVDDAIKEWREKEATK